MKQQISRFSPHQNGKVVAVLMAVVSLIVLIPFFLIASVAGVGERAPFWIVFVIPIVYLVFGYLSVVIGCALYNVFVPILGGFEYESTSKT